MRLNRSRVMKTHHGHDTHHNHHHRRLSTVAPTPHMDGHLHRDKTADMLGLRSRSPINEDWDDAGAVRTPSSTKMRLTDASSSVAGRVRLTNDDSTKSNKSRHWDSLRSGLTSGIFSGGGKSADDTQVTDAGDASVEHVAIPGEIEIDEENLKKALNRLEEPTLWPRNPVFDELLGQSGDVIVERTQGIFYLINLMSALIFNSFAGIALDPYNMSEFEGLDRTVAGMYNAMSAMTLMLNVVCTLLTTYILVGLNAESESTIFDFLLKENGSTFIYFLITSSSAVFAILMVFCANYLSSDWDWTVGIAISVLTGVLLLVVHFGFLQARLMPFQYSGWGLFANLGIMWGLGTTKERAFRRGKRIAVEARYNILGQTYTELEEDEEDEEDEAQTEQEQEMDTRELSPESISKQRRHAVLNDDTKTQKEFQAFIKAALDKFGKKGSGLRATAIANALLQEDLNMNLLLEMAGVPGSSSEHMLLQILQSVESGRLSLTLGEIISIIRALHKRQDDLKTQQEG